MSRMVSARQLVGRTIVAFDARPFDSGKKSVAHRPHITLDDGGVLYFVTEETEGGDYGTFIGKTPRKKRSARG